MVDDNVRLLRSFESKDISIELVGGKHDDGTETYDLISYSADVSPVCHNTFDNLQKGVEGYEKMVTAYTAKQAR